MESTSRTVRFKKHEIKQIEEFIHVNPFFDFSTLARVAILQFMQNPNLVVTAVPSSGSQHQEKGQEHGQN